MTKIRIKIHHAFDGKLVGSSLMKDYVCKTLSMMEPEIVNYITKHCWFMSSMEDAWAFTFKGNDLKDQHLIFLSDELFLQDEKQIQYTIAHEIGHVILNHRNSVLTEQTITEIQEQEIAADQFARKYIQK